MLNIYDYLFYKLYRVNIEIDSENAGFISAMLIFYFTFFNLLSLFSLYFSFNPEIGQGLSKVHGLIVGVALISFNLWYFDSKRANAIFERFKEEKPISNIFGSLFVLGYVIFSIYLCFWVALPFVGEIVREN
ncbi:hypothetical protein [Ekhidna sp.]